MFILDYLFFVVANPQRDGEHALFEKKDKSEIESVEVNKLINKS